MSPSLRDLFGKPRKSPNENPASQTLLLREMLFGDMPMAHWSSSRTNDAPWGQFSDAADALKAGDRDRAIQLWKSVTVMSGLEPRHYLQAWTFLRQSGVQPEEADARTVYGVIAEVSMPQGMDLLAAYSDYSARYYNYSGAGIVWEHPNSQLDPQIDHLLNAGRELVKVIGPWTEPRPGPPPVNQARISMLTPSGLFFGQGSLSALSADPKGKALVDSATDLMVHMTQLKTDQQA